MKKVSSKYKLYVFDLDNTLYCEKEYLFAAYRQITTTIAKGNVSHAEEYYRFLCDTFEEEGRSQLFQKLQTRFNLQIDMQELLDILRNTSCELHLFEPMRQQIRDLLRNGKQVAVLTNGNATQQRQKVHNLQLETFFPAMRICYAAEIDSKPSPTALLQLMQICGVKPCETLMIGDEYVDELTAKNAGVAFMKFQME